nr:hypothetical protein B0A51_02282 [Rachicladosporium sp. CCFEE 5018]
MADPMSPHRREQQISIITHDLESTLCSSATEISTSIDSPISDQSPGLPSELVRRSNSLRSRPLVASRPISPTDTSRPQSPTVKPESPDIVVLCLWPHATSSQISFYTTGYTDLYPSVQVLALRSSWLPDSRNREEILDALTTTTSEKCFVLEKYSPAATPTVLLHLFGQSGAQNATSLLRAYRTRTQSPMNVRAIISDSEPSFSLSLPTTLSQTFTFIHHMLLALITLLSTLLNVFEPHTNSATRVRDDLADPWLVPEGVRRGFVFAERNLMFSWDDRAVGSEFVEDDEDGEAVERRDYSVKRDCVDVRGRLTGDQERYWLGVEGVWEGGSG